MLTREKIEVLRRFAALYASIDQKDTVLKYLSIIYIKYVAETGIGMSGGDDFVAYTKVMKCFADFVSYPEQEMKLIVDRISEKTGRDMNFLLFSVNGTVLSWLFKNIEYKSLPGWNLSESNEEERKAELRDITEAVNVLSSMYFGYNRIGAAYSVVYSIASKILDVKKADTFADFVAGQGVSTFLITNGEAREYVLSDTSPSDTILILAALYGINAISVERRPLESSAFQQNLADKIFMDPPVSGVSLSEKTDIDGIEVRETTSASILRVVESLKENGIGIITAPGKTLVGTTGAITEIKQRLLEQHLLKAVLTLPPCWVGSSVKTNLLVISKENNDGVVFVDASVSKVVGITGDSLIGSEGQMMIPEIIKALKTKSETEISRFVSYKDIKDVNITPVAYLVSPKSEDSASVSDIDNRLSQVYVELARIISDMRPGESNGLC